MKYLVSNISGRVKRVTRDGRDYLVAPMTLLKEGILHGSRGPLFYPASEIETNVDQWNEVPILLGHPEVDGKHVSSKHPGVVEKSGLGFIRHSHVKDGKLRAEGWFDVERAKTLDSSVVQSLEAGKPIDLSTGLFTDNEPAANDANHNGRGYTHVARRYVADHLAILPRQRGACSVSDGCGVLVNKEGTENYSGAQPRDSRGRWSSGGGGGAMAPDTGGGSGGSPKSGGRKQAVKESIEKTSAAAKASREAGQSSLSQSASKVESNIKEVLDSGKRISKKGHEIIAKAHDQMSENHYGEMHKREKENVYREDLGGKPTPRELHEMAAYAHRNAADSHRKAAGLLVNKESNVPTSNQLAHDQLREQLSSLTRKRFGFEGDYNGPIGTAEPYVTDVFDKTFVYQYNGKLWELPYSTDLRTDAVEIGQDAPVQVRKVSSYKPVTNAEEGEEEDDEETPDEDAKTKEKKGKKKSPPPFQKKKPAADEEDEDDEENQEGKGPPNINEGGSNMTDEERKGIIDSLIANCDCGWTENDRPLLNALSEEQLERIDEQSNRFAEETIVANAAREGFEDERGNSHRFNPDEKRWESVLKEVPVTNEERLTPEEKRDLAYVANLRKQKREEMIKTITSNEKNPFTAEQLAEMDDAMLVNMAKLAHVEPKQEVPEPKNLPIWMGAGIPVGNSEPTINKHDTLDIPEIDWAAARS